MSTTDDADFFRLVDALATVLDRLVFIGGWAHRLYALHPSAFTPDFPPLLTRDADIIPPDEGDGVLNLDRLLKARGFSQELRGDDTPPISRYALGDASRGFYAEFLAPLEGSGRRRDGRADDTTMRAGVTVQKLRHLDLLLVDPWTVEVSHPSNGGTEAASHTVRVPNPATYLIQKLLVAHKRRNPGKEVLYVHDTILMFGADVLSELRPFAEAVMRERRLSKKHLLHLEKNRSHLFARVSDAVRDAADIARAAGRLDVTPERLRDVALTGLDALLGPAA